MLLSQVCSLPLSPSFSFLRRPIDSGVTILIPNNPFTMPIVAARRDADPPMYFYRIALRALEDQDRQIDPSGRILLNA